MKNHEQKRHFCWLSWRGSVCRGHDGSTERCDSSHVVTHQKHDFNEEGRTSIGTIKFTKCYRAFNEADTVNHNPEQWSLTAMQR